MQASLSFVDIIGIAGFIWSIVSFYIGYRWYKDGATKDTLIAKLTAENGLLRQEVQAISSADGGEKRERVEFLRAIDRQGIERLKRFYGAAYRFSLSFKDAKEIYRDLRAATIATELLIFLISIFVIGS